MSILTGRGLVIDDADAAGRYLLNGNYYRLSGYFRQFQVDPSNGDDRFVEGTTLTEVMEATVFDTEFASVLLDGVFEIERVVRSRYAYYLATAHGNRAFYLDPSHYLEVMDDRDGFVERLRGELARSKAPTIARYAPGSDYAAVPIWAAVELFSFGALSKMIEYATDDGPARSTADSLSVQWSTFRSTVHSLSVARNIAAHHGQFWHRRMTHAAPILKKERRHWTEFDHQGPFPTALAALRFLRAINKDCSRAERLEAFLRDESPYTTGLLTPTPK
ncbi:Abi family protein [Cellulomonas soli]